MMSFETALRLAQEASRRHLLLGNGFSRALRDDIFNYRALFDRADFSKVSANLREAFDTLETRDFELVMNALLSAASVLNVYSPDCSLIDKLNGDATGLREMLASTIANNHPQTPAMLVPRHTLHAESFCRISNRSSL
jgi:hypothetical protein